MYTGAVILGRQDLLTKVALQIHAKYANALGKIWKACQPASPLASFPPSLLASFPLFPLASFPQARLLPPPPHPLRPLRPPAPTFKF